MCSVVWNVSTKDAAGSLLSCDHTCRPRIHLEWLQWTHTWTLPKLVRQAPLQWQWKGHRADKKETPVTRLLRHLTGTRKRLSRKMSVGTQKVRIRVVARRLIGRKRGGAHADTSWTETQDQEVCDSACVEIIASMLIAYIRVHSNWPIKYISSGVHDALWDQLSFQSRVLHYGWSLHCAYIHCTRTSLQRDGLANTLTLCLRT